MFRLIIDIIMIFQKCFKREKTWQWFAVLIIGFMTRTHHRGITSIISFLRLKPRLYHTILHFFRSTAYKVDDVYKTWIKIVQKYGNVERVSSRVILLADHSKVSKEGRYIPDLQTLHQDSQNSGKAEYIEGHNYAQVSIVITNDEISRSIPLKTELQKSRTKKEKEDGIGESLVAQMLNLVCNTAKEIGQPVITALDAYFSSNIAWEIINKFMKNGKRLVEIVTRAQSNTVAFKSPIPPKEKKRGRTQKYGEKIKLKELFSDTTNFKEATIKLYGKNTKTKYLCLDLLWRPIKGLVRFVLVDTERGQCILMSSDLSLSPEEIIRIYAMRFKIETSFSEQKHDMGCFAYHFWTNALPKKKKWKEVENPTDEKLVKRIQLAKSAIESYVCLTTISTGILSLIAFSHSCEIWNRYPGWFRTLRTKIPTVATTKLAMAQSFVELLACFSFTKTLQRNKKYIYQDVA